MSADDPLYGTVSVWEESVTLGELVASLSAQSGAELHAAPDVAQLPVSVYVARGATAEVMACLARLVDGNWFLPLSGQSDGRGYWLGGRDPGVALTEQWLYEKQRDLVRAESRAHGTEREQRMQQYRSAYPLKPEEVREQFEATDPWLCATVLNPVLRPMISVALDLSAAQQEVLLTEGQVSVPLSTLSASLVPQLQSWVAGGAVSGSAIPLPDPDRVPRFSSDDERWGHAFVTLQWHKNGLQFRLTVPDTGRFQEDALVLPHVNPFWARQAMVRLGYVEDTPEYKQAALNEAQRWEQASAGSSTGPGQDQDEGSAPSPECPFLEDRVSLPASEGTLSVAKILEDIAGQLEVSVIATRLGHADTISAEVGAGPDTTAESVLAAVGKRRGRTLSWACFGHYLVMTDTDARFLAASDAAQQAAKRTISALEGKSVSLEQMVRLLGDMAALEISYAEGEILRKALAGPKRRLNFALYTSLSAGHREALANGERVPFDQLNDRAKRELLFIAQSTHPWMSPEKLRPADLRADVRTLSSGGQGIYITLEYNAVDDAEDRDVVFWFPLEITVKWE